MKRNFLKNMMFASSLICSGLAHAIPVGFNQSWFQNHYASQYLDGSFDAREVERIFDLTALAGSKQIRLWFFESSGFPMIEWNGSEIVGLRDDFIRNVLQTLRIAKNKEVKVYMTLLDGQSYRPDLVKSPELKKLRSIYQKKGGAVFLKKVVGPLLNAIDSAGLADSISRIDLSNEMDAVINRFGFDGGWFGAGRMLCQWKEFIQGYSGFAKTPVTFSARLHPLVPLPVNFFFDQGPMACADFFDLHSYHDRGEILGCSILRNYADSGKKDMILGEFGQSYFNHEYDDEMQSNLTENYIKNAEKCGFKEALAWRLSDIRPGYNKEARYSYEAYGKMRPAFWKIHRHNHQQR